MVLPRWDLAASSGCLSALVTATVPGWRFCPSWGWAGSVLGMRDGAGLGGAGCWHGGDVGSGSQTSPAPHGGVWDAVPGELRGCRVCLGGVQGVGRGAGTSGGGTQKLAEGFVCSAQLELGRVCWICTNPRVLPAPPGSPGLQGEAGADPCKTPPHSLCPRGCCGHPLAAALAHS